MEEKLRLEVLTKLSVSFNSEELKIISNALMITLEKYEISQKCTDIVVYQGELPIEIKSFLVCKGIKGLAKSSLIHYKRILTHFVLNVNKDVKNITSNDIRIYFYNYEKSHNVGKSTLDDKRRVLNSFYTWMVVEEYVIKNPMARIDPIKYETKEKEPLTIMELEQIRSACKDIRSLALLETLYSTGGRISEILALNKSDINFDTGKVKVFGKGKKERFVFLNAKAKLSLKKYIFSRADDNEALFVVSKKPYHRMGKGTAEKIIKELGIKANINRDVFPHLLRSTVATHSLSRGMSIAEVSKMLGHSSTEVTLRYAKMNLDDLQHIHTKCII